jgi:hypothetical protein
MISPQAKEEILRFVDQIVPPGTTGVWLCGSRAKGSARPEDWDVVAFHPAASPDPKDVFLSNQHKEHSHGGDHRIGDRSSGPLERFAALLFRFASLRHQAEVGAAPMPARRFPPPWTIEEHDACFIVRDANRQALAYVYFEDAPGSGRLLTC